MGEIICKLGMELIHLLIHALRRERERERDAKSQHLTRQPAHLLEYFESVNFAEAF